MTDKPNNITLQVSDAGARLLAWLPSHAVALFGTATRATLNLAIALIGLYYLLVQGDELGRHLRLILPVSEAVRRAQGAAAGNMVDITTMNDTRVLNNQFVSSHATSASNASERLSKGPRTGPPTGDRSASHRPLSSGST